MDIYLRIAVWAFQPQIWVIIGLAFILLEMTDGSAIFFLPMGIGAEIMALWIYLFNASILPEGWLSSDWYWLLVYWIFISVLIALVMSKTRKYRRSKNSPADKDINNY